MLSEPQLRIISRLLKSQEGLDFLHEVLQPMAEQNYQTILYSDKDCRDELVGYSQCLNDLIKIMLDNDSKLCLSSQQAKDWL